ncbi:ABC transporter ATP-binding protein [Muricoccus pecuniae]|uniref:NitT/TauT family transport system ATP-binding protein n=1 Tax=Muricoccus pecuniae TaxID=693023 RepID=A0A840YG94_9PROT|nr:ABC transporter ATP-binding protein [Roseomonas pecuniae]MBB5693512.1 NitT/TauT family transport system ATP-binding protein [Roseomonas pecuniae]
METLILELDAVGKSFPARGGPPTLAMDRVSLSVREGEFLSILGPSGCGKSTLLQIAAGLMEPSAGAVRVAGRAVKGPPPEAVYVFQQYGRSLLPWRSVRDNVAFAVEHRPGMSRSRARAVADAQLAAVALTGFGDHFPWQLSGGMQQRVALARALAAEPRILLMDEPFSAVDALTRLDLHRLMLELWEKRGLTVVLVTHDVEEAVALSDRVALLTKRPSTIARVVETGLPRPRDAVEVRETARFLELRHELLDALLTRGGHAG